MSDRAYVYEIIVDGVRRYVGKGSGYRARTHLQKARSMRRRRQAGEKIKTSRFYNRLIKALDCGSVIEVAMIVSDVSHEAAFAREVSEIAAAKPGQLWNVLSGGPSGSVILAEHRAKLSRIAKQRYADPEERRKTGLSQIEANQTPEVKRRRSESAKRAAARPGAREKQSKALKAAFADPEFKRRQSAIMKALWTEERRSSFGTVSSEMWADPVHKEKHSEALKGAWARPETAAKHRAYLDSPEGRAKLAAAAKARWEKHRATKELPDDL